MFVIHIWLISVLFTIKASVHSYSTLLYDGLLPPIYPYPHSRQNWRRSDNFANARYTHSGAVPGTIQSDVNNWSPTTTINSAYPDVGIDDIYRFGQQRKSIVFNRNPVQDQPLRVDHRHRHVHNHGPFQQIPVQNAREPYDDGLLFTVQRKSDGKLDVVFNDTTISDETLSISNRQSQQSMDVNVLAINSPTRGKRDIVFPDERRMQPRCAESGKLFCTEVENYPKDIIENVLRTESMQYQQLFGEDLVLPPNITQRIDVPGEESLCNSVEKLVYPQAGLTKDNNWSFIVNQQNYTQGVRIEECVNAGKPCSMSDSFPNGYTTECKQKYIYRQLLSVNTEGRVVKDLFQLPSCCKCIVKSMQRFRRESPLNS